MKNELLTLAFFLTLGPLVSCTPQTTARPQSGSSTLSEIQRRGELRAGYHVEPPSIVKDLVTGELGGSYINAIRQIAAGMHVKPVFVEVDLANFVAGLQNHLYDVSLGPTFKTIPRAQAVAFTNSIYYLGYTGVATKGTAGKYREESMIDAPGVRVAVKSGSPIEQYVRDNYKKATIVVIDGTDLSVPLQAVSAGKAEVGLMNEHTVEFYVRDHPDVEPVLTDQPKLMGGMGWTVLYGDPDFLNFLNTSLEVLISNGQMASWERENYSGKSLRRMSPALWGNIKQPIVP